jgi:hypothetical protein
MDLGHLITGLSASGLIGGFVAWWRRSPVTLKLRMEGFGSPGTGLCSEGSSYLDGLISFLLLAQEVGDRCEVAERGRVPRPPMRKHMD